MVKPIKSTLSAQDGTAGILPKTKATYQVGDTAAPKPGAVSNTTVKKLNASISAFKEDDKGISANNIKISSWGRDNLFPQHLMSLYQNNIFPGLMDFKVDMLYSRGYQLNQFIISGIKKIKVPVIDPEIEDWLESWDARDYIVDQFTDFVWTENTFTQMVVNKTKKAVPIIKLQHINTEECRLEIMNSQGQFEHIVMGNWADKKDFKPLPVFDRLNPSRYPNAMIHRRKKSFGFRYYNYPGYIGVIYKWLPLANEIPSFHLARMQNSINAKWHIKIPLDALKQLKELKKWNQTELDKWLEDKLTEIDNMLAGADNAGKAFYTFKTTDINGKEMTGWEIIELKSSEKEMSESNLRLFNETNQAITSAVQVQPSLACIQLGEKMSSGSEVLNAYNLHIKTRTPIARYLVLDNINRAIRINWPDKRVFLDIVDAELVKQETDKSGVNDPTE
ncbi:hypothetical protein [Massilibacteroides sp.]|uniref:hypothetical protein n=1 Tax=Massilibacteroides sp. TaxID=2034766 RepID=UPI002631D197|nr:hypothetical protein [Massilibacteroides sp.]MDD4515397.1 hypothetical protein [Massilibacteroides sp.]